MTYCITTAQNNFNNSVKGQAKVLFVMVTSTFKACLPIRESGRGSCLI
jgi:hypothetical protein